MLTTGHIAIKALTGLVLLGSTDNRAQRDKQFADDIFNICKEAIKGLIAMAIRVFIASRNNL